MPSESALKCLYSAVYTRLRNGGNAGTKVYPDVADDEVGNNYPYWVYFWAGGGESNQRRKDDADLTLGVKCVSNDLAQAFAGSQQISTLLNNQGTQDIVPATGAYVTIPLVSGSVWAITTSSKEEVFHFTEVIEETGETVYSDGAYYRFSMEEI